MSERESSNIIFFGKYSGRRPPSAGQPRVWRLEGNPADALRGRFITGKPWLLRALYAPRTSIFQRRRSRSLPPPDLEPIA